MATGFPTKANWAAGDVLTASALDDLAGTVNLLSNASAATGSQLISNAAGTSFAYQPTPSASNPVLNSAMQVWQRGTSISLGASAAATYTADRWQTATGANQAVTVSRQTTSDTTNLPNIQYCLRYQRNSGQTGTGILSVANTFESINSIPFAGKAVTVSFYARAGANYSPASSILVPTLISGTGTDQNPYSGFTGQATVISQNSTLTTTWQRFSYTGTVGTSATQLSLYFAFTPTGTAGTNDYFEVTGVQIDIGSVALPFRTTGISYQQELALCQRYYWQPDNTGTNTLGAGVVYSTTGAFISVKMPVTMRVTPTFVYTAGATLQAVSGYAVSAASLGTSGQDGVGLNCTIPTAVAGQGAFLYINGGKFTFSAEL